MKESPRKTRRNDKSHVSRRHLVLPGRVKRAVFTCSIMKTGSVQFKKKGEKTLFFVLWGCDVYLRVISKKKLFIVL